MSELLLKMLTNRVSHLGETIKLLQTLIEKRTKELILVNEQISKIEAGKECLELSLKSIENNSSGVILCDHCNQPCEAEWGYDLRYWDKNYNLDACYKCFRQLKGK